MSTPIASHEQIDAFIAAHGQWTLDGNALLRTYVFADFVTAFGFMAQAAIIAERANHHPDWSNVYKTVVVRLSTHESGGVTAKDFELGSAMEAIARRLQEQP